MKGALRKQRRRQRRAAGHVRIHKHKTGVEVTSRRDDVVKARMLKAFLARTDITATERAQAEQMLAGIPIPESERVIGTQKLRVVLPRTPSNIVELADQVSALAEEVS